MIQTFDHAWAIFTQPFFELLYEAHTSLKENFPEKKIQISTLLSIKTGGCPENCAYCPQSAHYATGVEKESLLSIEDVLKAAKVAKDSGSTRFCLGAAWRGPHDRDLAIVSDMIRAVKDLGLETCATLGLLKEGQAEALKGAGLDYYNHNIDSSPEFYEKIITTRTFEDRVETLDRVRHAGLKVCCGGILGMGETNEDRVKMLVTLANMNPPPESVPINQLIPIPGTPLAKSISPDPFDFVRTIALARILMPNAYVRLSAGREEMSDEFQALCFFAGANSIFAGEKLLTASNPSLESDAKLFQRIQVLVA